MGVLVYTILRYASESDNADSVYGHVTILLDLFKELSEGLKDDHGKIHIKDKVDLYIIYLFHYLPIITTMIFQYYNLKKVIRKYLERRKSENIFKNISKK